MSGDHQPPTAFPDQLQRLLAVPAGTRRIQKAAETSTARVEFVYLTHGETYTFPPAVRTSRRTDHHASSLFPARATLRIFVPALPASSDVADRARRPSFVTIFVTSDGLAAAQADGLRQKAAGYAQTGMPTGNRITVTRSASPTDPSPDPSGASARSSRRCASDRRKE